MERRAWRRLGGIPGFAVMAIFAFPGLVACRDVEILGLGPKTSDKSGIQEGEGSIGRASSQSKIPPVFDMTELFLEPLPYGPEHHKNLCGRGGNDRVRTAFCQGEPPRVRNLKELLSLLGLSLGIPPGNPGLGRNGNGIGQFTLLSHSTSVVGRGVSAINPRVIYFSRPSDNYDPNLVMASFTRGEQIVEIVARNPSARGSVDRDLNFFVLHFKQECNKRPGGCTSGELMGPAIESNWTEYMIYEDHDLENTALDCKHCHQPGGPGLPKILRMQELATPWTHYFSGSGNNAQLFKDYLLAHQNEEFAGIPPTSIPGSNPGGLEKLLRTNGYEAQPNEFPSAIIENVGLRNAQQRRLAAARTPDGKPEAWMPLYQNFASGISIPPPYYGVQVTDPGKLQKMADAYNSFRKGQIPPDQLPDIREVFDDRAMRDMGFMVAEGATAEQILIQACAQCHNSRLNQEISRAKFDVNLKAMDRNARKAAIDRLRLPKRDPLLMPPSKVRTLTSEEITKLEALLKESD